MLSRKGKKMKKGNVKMIICMCMAVLWLGLLLTAGVASAEDQGCRTCCYWTDVANNNCRGTCYGGFEHLSFNCNNTYDCAGSCNYFWWDTRKMQDCNFACTVVAQCCGSCAMACDSNLNKCEITDCTGTRDCTSQDSSLCSRSICTQ